MSAFKILASKPTEKGLLGRLKRRWEDNIRMGLKEIGINTRNWVDSAQDTKYWRVLVKTIIVPPGFIRYVVSEYFGTKSSD